MKFENKDQVKAWLRAFPVAKKEMELKIDFYDNLTNDIIRVGAIDKKLSGINPSIATQSDIFKDVEEYRCQIKAALEKYDAMLQDLNRLFTLLTSDEIAVITAKYLKGAAWDEMEFIVFFSRRQCFRILDRAIQKLIGQSVG